MTEAERQQRLAEIRERSCRYSADLKMARRTPKATSMSLFGSAHADRVQLLAEVERLEGGLQRMAVSVNNLSEGWHTANEHIAAKNKRIEELEKLVKELEAAYGLAVAKI